ncbi:hypothetical protein ElyMa_001673900 [Elysia marginata]|uniref:Uncharacterized protein n=1 Tax=Elysia marginata TaxID=1093978 RepID=A0AAV4JQ30_9GAST|nr:hypothetical protein ElyMa_001673900 [Elysia marginata]
MAFASLVCLLVTCRCKVAPPKDYPTVKAFLGPNILDQTENATVVQKPYRIEFPLRVLDKGYYVKDHNIVREIESESKVESDLQQERSETATYNCKHTYKSNLETAECSVDMQTPGVTPKLPELDPQLKDVCDFRCIHVKFRNSTRFKSAKFVNFGRGPVEGDLFCVQSGQLDSGHGSDMRGVTASVTTDGNGARSSGNNGIGDSATDDADGGRRGKTEVSSGGDDGVDDGDNTSRNNSSATRSGGDNAHSGGGSDNKDDAFVDSSSYGSSHSGNGKGDRDRDVGSEEDGKDKTKYYETEPGKVRHSAVKGSSLTSKFILIILGLSLSVFVNLILFSLWSSRLCKKRSKAKNPSIMDITMDPTIGGIQNMTYIGGQTESSHVRNGVVTSGRAERNSDLELRDIIASQSMDMNTYDAPENVYAEPSNIPLSDNLTNAALNEGDIANARIAGNGFVDCKEPLSCGNRKEELENSQTDNNKGRPNSNEDQSHGIRYLEHSSANYMEPENIKGPSGIPANYYATPASLVIPKFTMERQGSQRPLLSQSFSSDSNDMAATDASYIQQGTEPAAGGGEHYSVPVGNAPRVEELYSGVFSSTA